MAAWRARDQRYFRQCELNVDTTCEAFFKGAGAQCARIAMELPQMRTLFAFLKDESGATAIEYGLIAAGISVVIIASVNAIGSTLNSKFQYIADQLK
jgi:pilus assembly protein Flp/PilA